MQKQLNSVLYFVVFVKILKVIFIVISAFLLHLLVTSMVRANVVGVIVDFNELKSVSYEFNFTDIYMDYFSSN